MQRCRPPLHKVPPLSPPPKYPQTPLAATPQLAPDSKCSTTKPHDGHNAYYEQTPRWAQRAWSPGPQGSPRPETCRLRRFESVLGRRGGRGAPGPRVDVFMLDNVRV